AGKATAQPGRQVLRRRPAEPTIDRPGEFALADGHHRIPGQQERRRSTGKHVDLAVPRAGDPDWTRPRLPLVNGITVERAAWRPTRGQLKLRPGDVHATRAIERQLRIVRGAASRLGLRDDHWRRPGRTAISRFLVPDIAALGRIDELERAIV